MKWIKIVFFGVWWVWKDAEGARGREGELAKGRG